MELFLFNLILAVFTIVWAIGSWFIVFGIVDKFTENVDPFSILGLVKYMSVLAVCVASMALFMKTIERII